MNELITSELISIQNIKVAMFFFLPATAIWKWFLSIPNLVQEMAPNNQLFYLGSHYLLCTCIFKVHTEKPLWCTKHFFQTVVIEGPFKIGKKTCFSSHWMFLFPNVCTVNGAVGQKHHCHVHLSKMWNLEECSSVFCRFLMCLETMKLGNSKTDKDSGYIPSPWQVCVFFIYLFFCGWALNVLIFPVISQLATVWTCKTRIPEHKEQTSRVIPWKIKWTRRMKIYFLHWSPPSIVFCPLISTTLIQNLAQMLRKSKS